MPKTEDLAVVFRDVLSLPASFDVTALAYQQHPSWDSVAHMRLIAAIETQFDIMMETDQILEMSSYAKALEILKAHNVELTA